MRPLQRKFCVTIAVLMLGAPLARAQAPEAGAPDPAKVRVRIGPLSLNPTISKSLGTRHRAALGITEDSDAAAIVVSEETGLMSFVLAGQIRRALDATRLRAAIFQAVEGGDAKVPSRELAQRPGSETEANEIASI